MARRTRGAGRAAALLLVVAALVVAVALLGASILQQRPAASPTPTPAAVATTPAAVTPTATATAASPTPQASPPATGSPSQDVLDDRFGFAIKDSEGNVRIRSETSEAGLSEIPAENFAVSPDGRSLAWWHAGQGAAAETLYVRGAADPDPSGNTTKRLLTLEPGQRGGAIAWSSDSAGLVVAVNRGEVGIGATGGDSSELWTVELSSGAKESIARKSDEARVWWPLAWDRASQIVGAGTTGEGGFIDEYVAFGLAQRPVAASSTKVSSEVRITIASVSASTDARYILGEDVDNAAVHWWPVADGSRRTTVDRQEHERTARWRPETTQIAWVGGPIPAGCIASCGGTDLVLHDVVGGARSVATKVPGGTFLLYFRVDGSAAILAAQSALDATVVELATGATAAVADRGPFLAAVRIR